RGFRTYAATLHRTTATKFFALLPKLFHPAERLALQDGLLGMRLLSELLRLLLSLVRARTPALLCWMVSHNFLEEQEHATNGQRAMEGWTQRRQRHGFHCQRSAFQ